MERHEHGQIDLRPPGNGAIPIPDRVLAYVDRLPLGIAVVDGETHAVRYANQAFLRLTGSGGRSLVGRALPDALPRPASDRVAELIKQSRGADEPSSETELELERGDGERAFWCVSVWPFPARFGIRGDLIVQIRDDTDKQRERAQRADLVEHLRQVNERLLLSALREQDLADRAESANEAKSAFLATMSHELRTPLTAIIGYEELLSTGIPDPVTDGQREQLGRIKQSANHLLTLIDQILTLSRIEAELEIVQREPVMVGELLDWVETLIAPLAAAKGLLLTVCPPQRPFSINTDALKVRQILVNLLANAVKFTDAGEVALNVEEQDGVAVFEVRDTGPGIQPQDRERVFDAFWQVDQKLSRRVGGSGLGLSVARRLARLLGGDVKLMSEVGVGSIFILSLPLDHSS